MKVYTRKVRETRKYVGNADKISRLSRVGRRYCVSATLTSPIYWTLAGGELFIANPTTIYILLFADATRVRDG